MNNTYQFFNHWVYSNYLHRNRHQPVGTFAIDLQVFQNEYGLQDFHFPEIKFGNWSKLLSPNLLILDNSEPQYFGLIALQCHAAMLMEDDGALSEKIYRTRFIQLAGMSSLGVLDASFREVAGGRPVQEIVWENAVNHFSMHGVEIVIPPLHTGANRYVQFPKSQVVLNREDLKEYKPIFHELQLQFPTLAFKDFKNYIKRARPKYASALRRKNNRTTDLTVPQLAIRDIQIFNFYCSSWKDTHDKEKISRDCHRLVECIAFVESNKVEIFDKHFNPFPADQLPSEKWLFFKQSDYLQEYILQPKLEYGAEFLICYSNGVDTLHIGERLSHAGTPSFVRVLFNKDNLPSALCFQIIERYPAIIYGLKINRGNTYLAGPGPFIEVHQEIDIDVYQNGRKIPYAPENPLAPGKYTIRVKSFTDLNFKVVEIKAPIEVVSSTGIGRSLADYKISNSGNRIEGGLMHIQTIEVKEPGNKLICHFPSYQFPRHYGQLKKKILKHAWNEED